MGRTVTLTLAYPMMFRASGSATGPVTGTTLRWEIPVISDEQFIEEMTVPADAVDISTKVQQMTPDATAHAIGEATVDQMIEMENRNLFAFANVVWWYILFDNLHAGDPGKTFNLHDLARLYYSAKQKSKYDKRSFYNETMASLESIKKQLSHNTYRVTPERSKLHAELLSAFQSIESALTAQNEDVISFLGSFVPHSMNKLVFAWFMWRAFQGQRQEIYRFLLFEFKNTPTKSRMQSAK